MSNLVHFAVCRYILKFMVEFKMYTVNEDLCGSIPYQSHVCLSDKDDLPTGSITEGYYITYWSAPYFDVQCLCTEA